MYCSLEQLRKHIDAVKYSETRDDTMLSPLWMQIIKDYIDTITKEYKERKSVGQVDEKGADPITFNLMYDICQWCINLRLIFVWEFSVFQWLCMARSIYIDNLTFSSFNVIGESIVVTFDSTK